MFGKFFEAAIPGPGSRFHTGNKFWNFMNPGPFSKWPGSLMYLPLKFGRYSTLDIKEHVASQIMANTASVAATACFVFASDDLFYNITVDVGFLSFFSACPFMYVWLQPGDAIFTLLASQLIGYGFAGMFRMWTGVLLSASRLNCGIRLFPRLSNGDVISPEPYLCQLV